MIDRLAERMSEALDKHQRGDLALAEGLYREILRDAPGHSEALHYLGVAAFQRGRLDESEGLLREALAGAPEEATYHNSLGEVLRARSALGAAAACYRKAIALNPSSAEAYNNLGLCLMRRGEMGAARESFQAALECNPMFAHAAMNLGELDSRSGCFEEAIAAFERVPGAAPQHVDALVASANALLGLGRNDAAVALLERAIRARPDAVEAHILLGLVLARAGDGAGALERYRKASALDPDHARLHHHLGQALGVADWMERAVGAYWKRVHEWPHDEDDYMALAGLLERRHDMRGFIRLAELASDAFPSSASWRVSLGSALRIQGEGERAVAVLREAVRLDDSLPGAHNSLGAALQDIGCVAEARIAIEHALELDPDDPQALNNLGGNCLACGELERAREAFERALELKSDYAPAWENLSGSRRFGPADNACIERLQGYLAKEGYSDAERVSFHFALGKMLDDRGECERAFRHFEAGNRIQRANVDFDMAAHEARVTRLIECFSRARIEQGLPGASTSDLPVLIVGMPRSGTTLVEQILASHPRVHGAGELSFFHRVRFRDNATGAEHASYVTCLDGLDGSAIEAMTRAYLARLHRDMPHASRVTDKMPSNTLHLGLIAMAFPHATLIHCRRNAFDVCLSIYFQNFSFDNPFSWDLRELGGYYRQYERLMAHWRTVLPGRIHEVEYEALVADQESVSRALVAAAGMSWDDACLAFHLNERPVRTASHAQVRHPIYTDSLGRWRRYESFLGELKAGLADGCT